MDKVRAMQVFVRIVEANSFTKAAETLDLPRAALSATMQKLEARLGTRLLQRTTRRLSLTPEGTEYYRQCVEILGLIDAAELGVRGASGQRPSGKLRVDLPSALGRYLVVPRIGQFRETYPDVKLSISMTDRLVDLTGEGIDCALRVGALADSSMVARAIGSMRFAACAAPSYLARCGTPATIDALHGHEGVVHFSGRSGRPFPWELQDGVAVRTLSLDGPVAVTDAEANLACALQGLGIAQLARYQVRDHLAQGRLVEVLPQTPPVPMPVSLVYPQGRSAVPKVAAFIAWLTALVDADPDLAPGAIFRTEK
jgi:LysR family transcriptional regulator for bpeEF and oprC